MKISFFLRSSKKDARGYAPVYAKINIDGIETWRTTGVRCLPHLWDAEQKQVKKDLEANSTLKEFELRTLKRYTTLLKTNQFISVQDLFSEKKVNKRLVTIEQALTEFYAWQMSKILADGSKRGDKSRFTHLCSFFDTQLYVFPTDIDKHVGNKYIAYLVGKNKQFKSSSLNRHNKFLDMFCSWLVKEQYITFNPCSVVVKAVLPEEIKHLTTEEVDLLRKHKFASLSLERVRDLFLFSINTGMAYGDLRRFDSKYIQESKNRPYILIKRGKQKNNDCLIPLSAEALQILEKYEYHLPKISYDKYNKYIKECAEIVGIKQKITTHMGRKTCGMQLLNNGLGYDLVAKILGHSKTSTTKSYYARYMVDTVVDAYYEMVG